jgi:glycerophosphoryl diester phosphodiesterase
VAAKTLAELKRLDAGYRFTDDGPPPVPRPGLTIPTLEEVLAAFPTPASPWR